MVRSKTQNDQIRAESREKILSTARRLFAERGYDGCNVSDIARKAEMSQGNIYWYFSSKEELFKAVLAEGFETLGVLMAEAAAGSGTGLEKLNFFLDRFMTLMKEQGGDEFVTIVTTFVAQGGVRRFAEFGLSTHQIGAGYHQLLNAIFSQGQAEGTFKSDVDPNLLSTFFFSFVNGLMLMYPDEWKSIPDDVIRSAILRLLGIGIN
jgi:AcrR family transcriptional regulator